MEEFKCYWLVMVAVSSLLLLFFGRVVVVIVVVFVWGWLAAKYMHINMFCCATLHPGV